MLINDLLLVSNRRLTILYFTETLRKYPFGPFLNRHCNEDYVIDETGLTIEKGISVIVPLYGMHHDPKYFPEPDKFDPERFNDENKISIESCSYLPFGDGPRNCIGMMTIKHFIKNQNIKQNITIGNFVARLHSCSNT